MDDKSKSMSSGSLKRKSSEAASSFLPKVVEGPTSDAKVIICPLCQKALAEMSAEAVETHVNGCLDEAVLREKREHRIKRRPIDTKGHYTTKRAAIADEQVPMQPQDRSPQAVLADLHKGRFETALASTSVETFFREIEAVPLEPELPPRGAYTYTYAYGYRQKASDAGIQQSPMDLSATRPHVKGKGPRPLPSFKRIPGTSFTVDAFKYGSLEFCTAYFLTHFHSDHYGGLTKGFAGDIYCSRITANCVKSKFGLHSGQIHALPMNTRCIVHDVYVTLIDAEHCPGAVIILFEIPDKKSSRLIRIVHTGDFRASAKHICQIQRTFTTHISKPILPDMLIASEGDDVKGPFETEISGQMPKIDYLYLDTTYLEPSYSFPIQSQVVETAGQFCYQINRDPGYLQAHLNNVRNEKAMAKAKAKTAAVSTETPVSKVSLITQWFRPAQKAAEASTSNADGISIPATKPKKSRVLFVVGTYTIGKEKLFVDIALRIKSKVYVSQDKRRLLECIASPSIMALLTDNMYEAQVHAVSLGKVNMQGMSDYLASLQPKSNFTSIVAFSPTGWTHAGPYIPGRKEVASNVVPEMPSAAELDSALQRKDYEALLAAFGRSAHIGDDTKSAFCTQKLKPRGSSSKVTIFPVPYSEHSSFAELARFVCSLDIATIVPTVYSSSSDKNHSASSWLDHWQGLKSLFERKTSRRPCALGMQLKKMT